MPIAATLAASCIVLGSPQPLRLLFLGNSHTGVNDVPGLVKSLFESTGRKTEVTKRLGGLLNELYESTEHQTTVGTKGWTAVILQGAAISSSHKYTYSQRGALEFAKLAERGGARVILFAEWPRKGWDETDYILGIYRDIAKQSGAQIAPVCKAWDAVLAKQPNLPMWSKDGNHAAPLGSYLAALTLYYTIAGAGAPQPSFRPAFASSAATTTLLDTCARQAAKGG